MTHLLIHTNNIQIFQNLYILNSCLFKYWFNLNGLLLFMIMHLNINHLF